MSKPEVMVMSEPRAKAMQQLEEAYTLHRFDLAEDKPAFLAAFGPGCEAVVLSGHTTLGTAELDQMPRLRIVACISAGYESIDVAALQERGIPLTNSSESLLDDVADTALMLTLAARRQLIAGHAYVQSGTWGQKGMYPLLSATNGKKAGIVGLGRIGMAIAERFKPLKLEIGYTARSAKPVDYRYFADVVALADWADILVAVVPGGDDTKGMISKQVVEALGPDGTFVNVARGSVVDEPGLIEALSSGKLGSAGLDVYLNEPNPDPALTSLPNVTLYPHHASGTVETRDAMSQTVPDNLAAHFAGRPLLTPVFQQS